MLLKALKWASLAGFLMFLALFPARSRAAGGWSSSGGGSGVACFPNPVLAVQAAIYIKEGQTIPASLLSRAKLSVLERWEMNQTAQDVASFGSGASREKIVQSTLAEMDTMFPLFTIKMREVGRLIGFSNWQSMAGDEEQALIEDATPIVPLPADCRRIQIVSRYSNGNHKVGEGPVVSAPELLVRYSKPYFDLLSAEDQAMLEIHEYFYVLGQAIGHPSSDIIRGFVRIVFQKQFADRCVSLSSSGEPFQVDGTILDMKARLVEFFGDYIDYFSEDNKPVGGAPFTPQHHFLAFFELASLLHQKLNACLDGGGTPASCKAKVMNPLGLSDMLTEEQAFLYVSDFGLEQGLGELNADYLMNPETPAATADGKAMAVFSHAMAFACSETAVRFKQFPVSEKAMAYCRRWAAQEAQAKPQASIQGNKSN